jgi:RNA polymerase sigma-70 factor (ECF subfamily)
MSPSEPNPQAVPAPLAQFATTHWSVIVAARDGDAPQVREALAALCQTYWYPLYAYIRRQGYSWDQAQDLTQEFFTRLLEKDTLRLVDRARGKFRSFLIAACQHFLANERDRAQALKRGGGHVFVPIDGPAAESRYQAEPAHGQTPEKIFERRWALTLLDQVLVRLRAEFEGADKGRLFDGLKSFLLKEKTAGGYTQAAQQLGMTEGAVKVAVHRLRQRYRELLREEIGRTVHDPEHIDDEIRSLFHALGS